MGFKTREEFSGFPPQDGSMAGWEPSAAVCTLHLSYSKREGTEGAWQCLRLAAPPMTQPQLPGLDLLCPECPAMAGPLTVPGCWKSSSIPRGRLIRTPQRGGRIQPFVLQKKKKRNSLASVPAAGCSARLTMQTPCRLTVTPVRALPRVWD